MDAGAIPQHFGDLRSDPLFARSLNPIFVANDDRRFVDANAAACLFLRQPVESIRNLAIDDVTTPDVRPGLDAIWSDFLEGTLPTRTSPWRLQMPDGPTIPVDLSAIRNYRPGRHLAIVLFPAGAVNDRLGHAAAPSDVVLTKREREILTLVALGNTGVVIAGQLFVSPATVQTHVVNALAKLGARNRAHGITLALQANELDVGILRGGGGPSPAERSLVNLDRAEAPVTDFLPRSGSSIFTALPV